MEYSFFKRTEMMVEPLNSVLNLTRILLFRGIELKALEWDDLVVQWDSSERKVDGLYWRFFS
jgi:hypothetical protein